MSVKKVGVDVLALQDFKIGVNQSVPSASLSHVIEIDAQRSLPKIFSFSLGSRLSGTCCNV